MTVLFLRSDFAATGVLFCGSEGFQGFWLENVDAFGVNCEGSNFGIYVLIGVVIFLGESTFLYFNLINVSGQNSCFKYTEP